MSRVIEDKKNLTEDEVRYLQDREGIPGGGLPKGVAPVTTQSDSLSETEYTGASTHDAPGNEGVGGLPPTQRIDDESYEGMTKAALIDLIDTRNEERGDDEKLSRSGTKADLIAVLEADDEDDEEIS